MSRTPSSDPKSDAQQSTRLPSHSQTHASQTLSLHTETTTAKITPHQYSDVEANSIKNKAALSSVFWSGLLAVLKVAAGLVSNSLGMLSEALHSALDMVAASITWFAVRMSSQPADVKHPFGHGKVEHLAALAETLLLFMTCGWIVWEAIDRLFFSTAIVTPSWWVFVIVIISLVVDVNRSAMLRRVAKAHRSQALEADALHFTTDIWSSAVVLVGLICVVIANKLEPGTTLHLVLSKADAVAAMGVAGIVLGVSWNLSKKAITALMDGGNDKEAANILAALEKMAPVWQIRLLRVRESGAQYFVELAVAAPPTLRVDDAHEITTILEEIVDSVLPGAETFIHVEPAALTPSSTSLHSTVAHLASLRGLPIHKLALTTLADGLHIFVHIELPPEMPLTEAHAKVSAFENDLCKRLGAVQVISHIEPLHESPAATLPPTQQTVINALNLAMQDHPELSSCHDQQVWQVGPHISLALRCLTNPTSTVAHVHQLASCLEDDLRRRLPSLSHITIHVEPSEE